jgi:hypothetical protein
MYHILLIHWLGVTEATLKLSSGSRNILKVPSAKTRMSSRFRAILQTPPKASWLEGSGSSGPVRIADRQFVFDRKKHVCLYCLLATLLLCFML